MSDTLVMSELKALRAEVADLRDLIAGPKGARRYISGRAAAQMLGISYPTFKRRFIDEGRISPAKGSRFEKRAVERLREESYA